MTKISIRQLKLINFLSQLRGTPPYWQKIKYDAIAHIKQHGSFTWFITFSFNDLIYFNTCVIKKFQAPNQVKQYYLTLTGRESMN